MSDEVKDETLTAQVVESVESAKLAAKPAPNTAAEDEVTRLRSENEELKRNAIAEKAATESKEHDLRLKAAIAAAHKPVASLHSGQAAVTRNQAISKVGGLAYWMKLPVEQRCAILGVPDSASIPDKTLRTYFGASSGKSTSQAATALANSDPASYSRLKIVSIERGIY
jgi:hypothetical protein